MQKRILSAHCLPRFAASTFAIFGVAVLVAAGLTASAQPAAAQQGFGNFFSYQGAPKKRVVRKRRAPTAETSDAEHGCGCEQPRKSLMPRNRPRTSPGRRASCTRSCRCPTST